MQKKRILILFFSIVLIFLGMNFKFQRILHIKYEKENIVCFKGQFLNYIMLGMKPEKSIINAKILGITKETAEFLGVLRTNKMEYIVCRIEDDLKIYDKNKKFACTYKIGKGKKKIVSFCIEDLNNDGNDEILLIIGKKGEKIGNNMQILSFDGGLKEVYNKFFSTLNPWKVQTADVDGDGKKEIAIGVYKKTKFYPIMEKRPFIYEWRDGRIFPKWRGSRLSKPFDDYIFLDIDEDKMDEIIAIEVLKDGRKTINAYKWKGFGFEGIGESGGYEQIYKILKEDENNKIYAKVKDQENIIWVVLIYKDGRWMLQDKVCDYVPIVYMK
ncbi:FG-GAP repeat domain-containing protein [Marinisporobacter balticus]|nr:VCBS repeat-containing protein [Marinisporobacter balticus]